MENFEEVDVSRAKELMGQEGTVIVDVRDKDAYEEDHIDNAVNVHDGNIQDFVDKTDKTRPILCYCYMGFSSQGAAQYLKDQGFETVYSMIGGFTAWQQENENPGETQAENGA